MDEITYGQPDILLASVTGMRWNTLRSVIGTWDMLNADVPSRDLIEASVSTLVTLGLLELDGEWRLRLTKKGVRLRKEVRAPRRGMRSLPSAIRPLLSRLLQEDTSDRIQARLPDDLYGRAYDEYHNAAARFR